MKNILIADDERGVGLFLSKILEKQGYQVKYVENGEDALAEIHQGADRFDLLITDVHMPKLDGFELLDELVKLPKRPPAMIITAAGDRQTILEALRRGCQEFIDKPIIEADVIDRVSKVFDKIAKDERERDKAAREQFENQIPNYKFIDRVGEGVSGTVYLCDKLDDNRRVAIKILKLEAFDNNLKDVYIKRFVNEGFAISQLSHPHIINFIEFGYCGTEQSRSPYIVMEYFQGRSLIELIHEPEMLNMDRKLNIISQVSKALGYMHGKSILHRDVKPGNILIDKNFNAKLTDFGICGFPNSELTLHFEVLGSPGYVAPEYWLKGKASKLVDVYSLGVVAYELFVGKPPFEASSLQELRRNVIYDRPPEPRSLEPAISYELQEIIGKMIRKNPQSRYQDAADISRDIEKLRHNPRRRGGPSLADKVKGIFTTSDWR